MLLPTITNYFDAVVSSSLILIIMTQGQSGGIIHGDDGEVVYVRDIIDVMQTYKDKPKMIILQVCRGGE